MYCRKCHYDLRRLGDIRQCPECGTPFSPDVPGTYLKQLPEPRTLGEKVSLLLFILVIGFLAAWAIQFVAAAQNSGH